MAMGQAQTILVVEDDLAIQSLIIDLLAEENYNVRAAGDGQDALTLLQGWRPDLIILDQVMPRMDGTALRTALQHCSILAQIPVILVSAMRDLLIQEQDRTVAAIITKPFDLDQFLCIVRQVLATDVAARQPACTPRTADPTQVVAPNPT